MAPCTTLPPPWVPRAPAHFALPPVLLARFGDGLPLHVGAAVWAAGAQRLHMVDYVRGHAPRRWPVAGQGCSRLNAARSEPERWPANAPGTRRLARREPQ